MSRIGANTLALTASFFSTAILGLIWYKIITNAMPQEEVGVFVSLFATGAMLGTLTEMGLPQVLVRFGARFDARGNVPRFYRLILLALKAYGIGLVVLSALLLLGGERLVSFFSETLRFGELRASVVLLAYLALSSGTLRAINNAGFRGLRQMTWIPILETLFSFLITVSYFVFRNRLSAEMCLVIFWVCSATVGILGLIVLFRMIRRLAPQTTGERGEGLLREITPYWRGVAPSNVMLIAVEQVDKILIPAILSLQSNAIFAVISRFANVPRRLLYQPMQVMNPEVTRKWEQGRGQELRDDLHLFIKLQLGLGLAIMVPIAILAKPLISLVSTPEYVPGAPALWVFCFVLPLLTMHQPLLMMLRAIGQVWHAFGGDALWILTYLGVGVALSQRFDLTGFVAGQAVASVLVLSYTLWAFHRLDLPRPGLGSFAGWVGLSLVIWGVSVGIGRALPDTFPWWALCLVGGGCLVVLNMLLVLGGFLSRTEIDRTVSLLAGRGGAAKAVRLFLLWPMRLRGGARALGILVFLAASPFALNGCTGGLQHGCSCNDDVPADVQMEILAAAEEFFQRVADEDAAGILENAAEPVRTKMDIESFVGPVAQQIFQHGFPEVREMHSLRVVHLKSGHPIEYPIPCFPPGESRETLRFRRHPNQASVVFWSPREDRVIKYSLLFWKEEDVWRVGAFEVGTAEVYGHGWKHYEHLGDEQAEAGNHRNAAHLYNLTLNLLVPNDWTRSDAIERIETKQRQLQVVDVPRGSPETWEVEDTDFTVYRVTPDFSEKQLGLAVFVATDEDPSDSLLMVARATDLADYVRDRFPEYQEVFEGIHVVLSGREEYVDMGFSAKFPLRRED